MICPNCGFANKVGDDFCGSCRLFLPWQSPAETEATETGGVTIIDPAPGPPEGLPADGGVIAPGPITDTEEPGDGVKCAVCGASNPMGRVFCQVCGNRLDILPTRVVPVVPVVPVIPPPPIPGIDPRAIAVAVAAILVTGLVAAVMLSSGGTPNASPSASPTDSSVAAASGSSSPTALLSPTPSGSPSPTPSPTRSPTPAPPARTFDLAITGHSEIPDPVVQGDTVKLTATIKNLGTGTTPPTTTRWYRYGPNRLIEEKFTPTIRPGMTRKVDATWDTSGVAPGTYEIRILADLFNEVSETRADNNEVRITIEVVAPATPTPTPTPTRTPKPTPTATP